MANVEDVLDITNNIIDFCQKHNSIYLYGAGNWGQRLYHALRKEGIQPSGFIITNGEPYEVLGCQVLPVSVAISRLGENCGVIVAFREADITNIRFLIGDYADIWSFPRATFEGFLSFMSIKAVLDIVGHRRFKKLDIEGGKESWKNILVIRIDVIGDLILTTPFLRELRRSYPACHITLVVNANNKSLFQNCPYVDELLLYKLDDPYASIGNEETDAYRQACYFAKQYIHKRKYDIVFLPRNLLDGRNPLEEFFLAYESKANYLVGRMNNLRNDRELSYRILRDLFSFISYETEEKHETLYMLDMLKKCGGIVSDTKEELWPSESDREFAKKILKKHESFYIAVALVGSTESRNWPLEKYSMVFREFEKKYGNRFMFVLMGGGIAVNAATVIMRDTKTRNLIDLTGKTDLSQAAAIMERCRLYIGADTGLMHMAAAMGTPVVEIAVSLPGHTAADGSVPMRMGPWGVKYIAMQAEHGLDGCAGICRKNYPHCITLIKVDDVVEAAEKLLREVVHIDL